MKQLKRSNCCGRPMSRKRRKELFEGLGRLMSDPTTAREAFSGDKVREEEEQSSWPSRSARLADWEVFSRSLKIQANLKSHLRKQNNDQDNCDQDSSITSCSSESQSSHHLGVKKGTFKNSAATRVARFITLHLLAASMIIIAQCAASFPPSPAINPIGGLQQSMAQMLQVFNGNDSQHLNNNHFKLLERHGDFLLVGARNVVYNLSLSSMREVRRLEWPSSDEDTRMCRMKGKSPEQCQNYIRVLKLQTPNTLFVCGTNAYKPRCRTYLITSNAYELASELPGEGACPYQENQNVTSLFADGELYSATVAQFSGIDGLIHRTPLRTEQFNPKQLNSPNFVSSFRYGEHVYFLFRESAIEHINCGKTIYSRIARVCINDSGGQTRASRERWTSFVKARLNCSIPGEYPFYFDEIQASTHIVPSNIGLVQSGAQSGQQMAPEASIQQQQANSDLLYAVFTTPTNSIGGSAVCAFRMSDVLAAFDGPFKSQADSNSNWLPVPDSKVPQPRPGSCVNDSKRLPDENINFIKDNPLMDTAIEAIWSQPLVMMASINFRFTQIVVDPQVETSNAFGSSSMRTDVIFVSTDDGRVFKLINTHHLFGQQQQHHHQQRTSIQPNYAYSASQQEQVAAQLRHSQPTHHQLDPFPVNRPVASAQVMASLLTSGTQQQQQTFQQEPPVDVSGGTIVIEELHLFDSRTPILNMLIHYPADTASSASHQYPKLVVLAAKQLKAIPLNRCERALTCSDCVALYDPYCAWDARKQVCLGVGRSTSSSFLSPFNNPAQLLLLRNSNNQFAPQAPPNWFPPNNMANNYTIAWWLQCPQPSNEQQQVGLPFRSLFSSHLQVPSRFDYASGHHLSHTALVSLSSPPSQQFNNNNNNNNNNNFFSRPQQPVSECLTFCGGVYTPQTLLSGSGPNGSPSGGINPMAGESSQLMMNCADYVQQHCVGNMPSTNGFVNNLAAGINQQTSGNLYTSENLYFAVIICAVVGLILGLVFGFAIGKNSKKHDSSVCSSTFADETNLYMASTGLRNGSSHLYTQQRLHHPLLQQSAGNGLLSNNSNVIRPSLANNQQLYDANQSLLNENYGNQQQMLLQLTGMSTNNGAQTNNNSSMAISHSNHLNQNTESVRSGALPPLPIQQAPLVNTSSSTTHINHSQLTPNSVNSSMNHQGMSIASKTSSTNTSSCSSATVPVSDHHHQMYLNQQQALMMQATNQPQIQNNNNNSIHQRSFTNASSNNSSVGKCSTRLTDSTASKLSNGKNYLQQQSQQNAQQQQQNNKIFL